MAARFRASFDGGSRGNPGPAAWAVALYDEAGRYLEGHAGSLSQATNNVAEYTGLIRALELALRSQAEYVLIRSDSELIVRQIEGRYRVRHPNLIPLHGRAMQLIARIPQFEIRHVRRKENGDADKLVNRALDRALASPDVPVRILDRPDAS